MLGRAITERNKEMTKKKKVKEGMHKMEDGTMMSDKEMQGMMKKKKMIKGKKKTPHYRMG